MAEIELELEEVYVEPKLAKTNAEIFKGELSRRLKQGAKHQRHIIKLRTKLNYTTEKIFEYRAAVVSKFNAILNNQALASKLEKVTFNWTIDECTRRHVDLSWQSWEFRKVYNVKVRSLIFNLSNEKNSTFRNNVISKKFSVREVPGMSIHDIYPELWEPIFEKQKQKMLRNMMMEKKAKDDLVNSEGMFKCIKCSSRATSYYSIQTRSADEPMTNYITCHSCSYNWKD